MEKEHYKILGIEKDATADTIEALFDRLLREFSPEPNTGAAAGAEESAEGAEIFCLVSNRERRESFDRFGYYVTIRSVQYRLHGKAFSIKLEIDPVNGFKRIRVIELESPESKPAKRQNLKPSAQTEINLGDVVLSMHYLAPTSEKTRKAIAKALGFEWQIYIDPTISTQTESGLPENQTVSAPNKSGDQTGERPGLSTEEAKTADESPEDIITLTPQEEKETVLTEIFSADDLAAVDPLPPTVIEYHFKKPPFVPLLDEKWFRAIMSLILATPTVTSEIDFKRLEARLVKLAPVRELPKIYRNTLQKGVQIMLDVSESMQPFRRDQEELVSALAGLLDKSRLKIFKYELKTAPDKRLVWHPRGVPDLQAETPVLMVTNFHVSNRQRLHRIESHAPLVDFFGELENKKCPVAALVPLPEELFPKDLKNFAGCSYSWDRDTSPQTVSRIRRK